ncbi:hypothetical protein BD289DRAFT_155920 [Coniella lustricola]|uniref:Uncharacterized protein n=1 Tax=Coniella lustricola TaxID=2025994 RepID=A0A2T3AMJ3_9PEZI|nr:hypothetical protein BD289DRAFT_155920 [Coniella lustricola]
MPCLTQSFPRKRRRDDEDLDQGIHITMYVDDSLPQRLDDHYTHNTHQLQPHISAPRKPIAFLSPLAKKIRMAAGPEWQAIQEARHTPLTAPQIPRHCRSLSATVKQSATKPTSTNLDPCHICHRRPAKKTELDSFADCQGCGERTCYVCIRECLGWKCMSTIPVPRSTTATTYDFDENVMRDDCHEINIDADVCDANQIQRHLDHQSVMNDAPSVDIPNEIIRDDGTEHLIWGKGGGKGHRGRICSQCCVEEGPEGEVICLGCLGT